MVNVRKRTTMILQRSQIDWQSALLTVCIVVFNSLVPGSKAFQVPLDSYAVESDASSDGGQSGNQSKAFEEKQDGGGSWSQFHFGLKRIGSTRFHSFRLNVFNDPDNTGLDYCNNRYFYTPLNFMNVSKAHCTSYEDVHAHEVILSLIMWNDESQQAVTSYINNNLQKRVNQSGCPVTPDDVEVIPFEQIKLLRKGSAEAQFYGCTIDSSWSPYQAQQVVEFPMSCPDQNTCESLATSIKEGPQRFLNHLQVAFRFTSVMKGTRTKKMRVTSLLIGQLASRIDQRFGRTGKVHRALLSLDVYESLAQEAATNIVIETFDDSEDLVDDWTHENVVHVLEKFLESSATWVAAPASQATWDSVFWDEEEYRPDKVAAKLNNIYGELGTEGRKLLEEAFVGVDSEASSSNPTRLGGGSKLGLTVGVGLYGSLFGEQEIESRTLKNSDEYINALLDKGMKEYVRWDGGKFVPKGMKLMGINLAKLRNAQSLTEHRLRVRYAPSVLTTPVNLPRPSAVHAFGHTVTTLSRAIRWGKFVYYSNGVIDIKNSSTSTVLVRTWRSPEFCAAFCKQQLVCNAFSTKYLHFDEDPWFECRVALGSFTWSYDPDAKLMAVDIGDQRGYIYAQDGMFYKTIQPYQRANMKEARLFCQDEELGGLPVPYPRVHYNALVKIPREADWSFWLGMTRIGSHSDGRWMTDDGTVFNTNDKASDPGQVWAPSEPSDNSDVAVMRNVAENNWDDRPSNFSESIVCRREAMYRRSPVNNKYYRVYPNRVTQAEADAICKADGGSLANPVSELDWNATEHFRLRMRYLNWRSGFWIAGTDAQKEGVWKFPDGTVFNIKQRYTDPNRYDSSTQRNQAAGNTASS